MKILLRTGITGLVTLSLLGAMLLQFNVASAQFQTKGFNNIIRAMWGANEALRVFNINNPLPQLANIPPNFYVKYANELRLQKIVSRMRKVKN